MVKIILKVKTISLPQFVQWAMSWQYLTVWHYLNFTELNSVVKAFEAVQGELFQGLTLLSLLSIINRFIAFTHHFLIPLCSHSFTHESLSLWIPPESCLGSRAKAATLSLHCWTGVESTNRLLWPNVIKLQSESGQITVRRFRLSRVSSVTRVGAERRPLKNDFITIRPGLKYFCGITLLWRACLIR